MVSRARRRAFALAILFGAGLAAALFASGTGTAAKAPPPTTTTTTTGTTCTLTPQLRGVTINQGLNSYLALARGKETLVRPYLSLPSCAWGVGAIQVTGGSVTLKNGSTTLGSVSPTPAVATPFPQLPTFATAPSQDGPADLRFVVPASFLAPQGVTARWTASFEIAIDYQVKANSTDTAYGQTQTIRFTTFGGTAISKTVEQQTRAIGILFVPLGVPLDATTSGELLRGLTAFSGVFPYQDGTTPPGTAPGVRLGDLAGVQGGVRYAVNAGVVNVPLLNGLFCGTAGGFESFRPTLAQFRQAWNTGNATGISAGTVSAADKVIGVVNEANADPTSTCLQGYASVTSPEAWIRGMPNRLGSLLGMEFCHTFGCVPSTRSDGAYHSLQSYADVVAGDVNRGYSVIDRTLIDRPRTAMRLVDSSTDPWSNSTTLLERDDYAFMLCQMGGFAARNTPCPTSGGTGTLAGSAAGPAFVMTGSTDGTPVGTSITNAYFETGVAQTTPLQGSVYTLVQKNGNTVLRTDGVPVSVDHTEHHGTDNVAGSGRGMFSVAFPFNTTATTIEFRKAGVTQPLFVFRKTDPPVVTSFSVTAESTEPPITLRSLAGAPNEVEAPAITRDEPARREPAQTRPKKAGSVDASSVPLAGSIAVSRLPGSVKPFGFFARLGVSAIALDTTYVVNTGTDPQTPDGVCDATECTLREAITLANANAGLDTIQFTTAGVDVESELPTITDPVTIDGTQPGGTPALIELNGGGTSGANDVGLRVGAGGGGTTIRRLAIVRFPGPGIVLAEGTNAGNNVIERNHIGTSVAGTGSGLGNSNGILVRSDDNRIGGLDGAGNLISGNGSAGVFIDGNSFFVTSASRNRVIGNLIGTTISGAAALGNGGAGVGISGPRALDNVIGGTTADARNVISANVGGITISGTPGVANKTVIQGNYIGTNAAGTAGLGNTAGGISVSSAEGNTIGGTAAGAGNVISSNGPNGVGGEGIHLAGADNTVQGNLIGTDATGAVDLGNGFRGILIQSGGNVIGGTSSAARNVISGNSNFAVQIAGGSANQVLGNYIGASAAGTAQLANGAGIQVNSNSNAIGGTVSGAGNVISGNTGDGLAINGGSNVVQGNRIGTDASGSALGNGGRGVLIQDNLGTPESGVQNTIGGSDAGAGNVIANNGLQGGVVVSGGTRNSVLSNSISANTGVGIDIGPTGVTANDTGDGDTGANNLQNFPVITEATSSASETSISGSFDGDVPNAVYRIEFFRNAACDTPGGNGEGQTLIGASLVTSDAQGDQTFTGTFPTSVPVGEVVTATATDPNGNTSEFSACLAVTAGGGGTPTFTVNSNNDADDGACTTVHCSLREAINATNAAAGTQTISFAIGTGTQTISPTSALPTVTDPVVIDGTTQPGFSGTPIIELNGTGTPAGTVGLNISAGSSTVRGLVVNRFPSHGIFLTGTTSTGNVLEGNYVGTNVAGTADLGNGREGIRVESQSSRVGGTTTAARNVVSGNNGHGILLFGSTNTLVQGNYAGTNAAGTAGIPNGIDGIIVDGGGNNTIGGTAAGAGNVASGNTNQGIAIAAVQPNFTTTTGNVVQGNKIGTDVSGTSAIPNGVGGLTSAGDGVRVHNGSNTTIGGTAAGAANVIAYNRKGVAIFADTGLTATGNRVSGNQIHSNTDLGIDLARNGVTPNDIGTTNDLDSGPNNLQNFPVVDSVRNGTIEGHLASDGGKAYDIEFFANAACDPSGNGEGARSLGSTTVTTDAAGNVSFSASAPSVATGEWVTATATDPTGNTSEFSACKQAVVTAPPTEPGPVEIAITGTDDNPGSVSDPFVRGTLYWSCGSSGPKYPLVVDARPSAITGNQVEFDLQVDTEPLCAGGDGNGTFTFRMTDLWQQSVENQQSHQVAPSGQETPSVSILNPEQGDVIRENAGVTLVGNAFDAEAGAIPGTALSWAVTCETACPGFTTISGSGSQLDVKTEIPGTYRATLTVNGFGGPVSTSVTYVVTPDSDNDGMTDAAEACLPADKRGPSDDGDGDGIWNANDPEPCSPHQGAYQADGDFNPDPLPLQSRSTDPAVTFYVTLPYRDLRQVNPATVRISRVGDTPVSMSATSWTVASTGVATAKFDRGQLVDFLNNGFVNKTVVLQIEGQSTTNNWSFFATDSTTTKN